MNNFVVLPPSWQEKGNYLSVLDFDLAFSKKDFIYLLNSDEEDMKRYMMCDEKVFDMYMNNQRYGIENGIAGAENMNFLYTTCDFG